MRDASAKQKDFCLPHSFEMEHDAARAAAFPTSGPPLGSQEEAVPAPEEVVSSSLVPLWMALEEEPVVWRRRFTRENNFDGFRGLFFG